MTNSPSEDQLAYGMSNEELAAAIQATRDMLRRSAIDSPTYMPLSIHFKLLLELQYKRASWGGRHDRREASL